MNNSKEILEPKTFKNGMEVLRGLRDGLQWSSTLVVGDSDQDTLDALAKLTDAMVEFVNTIEKKICGCRQALMTSGRAGCRQCEDEIMAATKLQVVKGEQLC